LRQGLPNEIFKEKVKLSGVKTTTKIKMDFTKYKKIFSDWKAQKDFSKMDVKTFSKMSKTAGILLLLILLYSLYQIYIPVNYASEEMINYVIERGSGNSAIAEDLENKGIIKSAFFFRMYTFLSFNHTGLMAGKYTISPKMSIYKIVKKMTTGDTIRDRFVIYEGMTAADIGEYFESREVCTPEEFDEIIHRDYSKFFPFLTDKPADANLEGYLFPDTYEVSTDQTCEQMIDAMLINFGNKLTLELQEEIKAQNKTIFEVVTMASLIEKEVGSESEEVKKTVSGILHKRLEIGMPLQLDSTVNYVTGKTDSSVLIVDTQIDSPYNTYKYKGLPIGPISNPGLESIMAALDPIETDYLYYLSNPNNPAPDGATTHYAKTLKEHAANRAKYLD
jgi:UPF0755 protein